MKLKDNIRTSDEYVDYIAEETSTYIYENLHIIISNQNVVGKLSTIIRNAINKCLAYSNRSEDLGQDE